MGTANHSPAPRPALVPGALAPLVALEGIDGSGKGTQAAKLVESLTRSGLSVQLLSFPRYTATFFGQRVADFLNGRFGQLADVNPFLVSLLYAADRFESAQALSQARQSADLVVLDRFVHSNIAHQTAKAPPSERAELRSWIEHVEHELFGLPKPDLVVLLDLPVSAARELIGRKAPRNYTDSKADLQEADEDYLTAVSDCYRELSREPSWRVVSVTNEQGLRAVDEIAGEILNQVRTRLLGHS